MNDEPVWISKQALLLKQAELLRLFGGAEGVRDEGALDSALMRPVNIWSYDNETGIPRLAAAYAFGLVKNHAFIDGNKRTAFIAYVGFLKMNRFNLVAPQPDAYRTMIALATGDMTEQDFAAWIEANMAERRVP